MSDITPLPFLHKPDHLTEIRRAERKFIIAFQDPVERRNLKFETSTDYITVDFLHDDLDTFKRVSLVSKAWFECCHYRLFGTISRGLRRRVNYYIT